MNRKVKIIEVKESILNNNECEAESLRSELKKRGTFLLNLMSSPGSGKTSTLVKTIEMIKGQVKMGVMEADIDSDVDAVTIEATGIPVIQLHTGGMCHLDASMTAQGLSSLSIEGMDLVVLENVGNLVCPAEFDTGAACNVMILSVPEGDDKALKYPLMFKICDVVLVNKIDTLHLFNFNMVKFKESLWDINPNIKVIPISATTGEGIYDWTTWLLERMRQWKEELPE